MNNLKQLTNEDLIDAYESLIHQQISNRTNFEAYDYVLESKNKVKYELLSRLKNSGEKKY